MVWVLSPLLTTATQQQATAPQSLWWLTGPDAITVGRPLKGSNKAGTDLVISSDSSVSKVHATLAIPSAEGEQDTITITDSSKFGTFIRHGSGDLVQIQGEVPTALRVGDHVRFGLKSLFELRQVPTHVHVPEAQLPAVTAVATHIGAQATSQWSSAITHCLAADSAAATPAVVAALLCQVPLVQRSWLEAVVQKKAWEGQLPAEGRHAPRQLTLSNGSTPELADWHAPPRDLLSAHHFVMAAHQWDGALEAAVEALGGVMTKWSPGDALPARSDRVLTAVMPDGRHATLDDSALAQLQHSMRTILIGELLQCMLMGDMQALQRLEPHRHEEGDVEEEVDEEVEDVTEEDEEEAAQQTADNAAEQQQQQQTASTSVRQQLQTLEVVAADAMGASGHPSSKRSAEEAHLGDPGEGWRGSTQKKRRGEQSLPAHPAATGQPAAHTPARGRGKQAGHPAAAPPSAASAPPAAAGDDSSVPANEVLFLPLVVSKPPAAPSSDGQAADGASAGPDEVPNYKAFRRKGAAVVAVMPPQVPLVVYAAEGPRDTDAEAFLLEEQQRKKRQQKADELFTAVAAKPKPARKR